MVAEVLDVKKKRFILFHLQPQQIDLSVSGPQLSSKTSLAKLCPFMWTSILKLDRFKTIYIVSIYLYIRDSFLVLLQVRLCVKKIETAVKIASLMT
jgi:hypothetical protein